VTGTKIDGSGTVRARCVLAPNASIMTLDGTNTWIIAEPGSTSAIVVDPGPDHEGHLRRVQQTAEQAGQRISRIVLTHGHLDHSAGARRLAELTGADILAVDPALRMGSAGLSGTGLNGTGLNGTGLSGNGLSGNGLGAGASISGAGCDLRVIVTPGHTSDSVCLLIEADAAVLTGDTVLGRGTTVIARDGSLGDYLSSLARLRALADSAPLQTLLPGHGPVLADPAGVLDFYISHRADRLAEVEAALSAGDRSVAEIVARVYAEVDRSLWPFARSSVRASLAYLAERGALPPGMSQ
jgi:glyoxylase-like metal-dependent hydrolase (beta-lactamase superfamily II)